MAHWLMKSEPCVYSWDELVQDQGTSWSGVRNYQANNNMKAMEIGDEAFFYHSNDDRAIIGVMKIVKRWHCDPADDTGRFGMVDVVPVKTLATRVTLAKIKMHKELQHMQLLRLSRLSVAAVTEKEWTIIVKMSGTRF